MGCNASKKKENRNGAAVQRGPGEGIEEDANQERTLVIIKPDAVAAGHTDAILQRIEEEGLEIIEKKSATLTKEQVETFYEEHKTKPFFNDLCEFMTSGESTAVVVQGENSIQRWRDLMGPTNSITAKDQHPKTIRALYGLDGSKNAAHGSDSKASAEREIGFFFGFNAEPAEPVIDEQPTSISAAAAQGNLELVKTFLEAEENRTSTKLGNSLCLAARSGHADVIAALFEHDFDINTKAFKGMTALHEAAKANHLDVVKALIAKGVDASLTNAKQETALHLAARADASDVVSALLEAGVDKEAKNVDGQTAAEVAGDATKAFL